MSEIQSQPNSDQLSFIYGDEAIGYTLFLDASAKADKIQIKVQPNAEVIVKANATASPEQIHQAVMKRARWIYQSLQAFKAHQNLKTNKHYRSGDMMFYLGRRYVLKLVESTQKPTVKLIRGQLRVLIPSNENANIEQIKSLTQNWYRTQAQRVFTERLNALIPKTDWIKEIPPLKIRVMKTQWGSCSVQGTIILNPHLIKASKQCIDYVILHELCHIAEHNHSERFWRLLTQVMPNWKEVKLKLDGMAEQYLV